MDPLLLEELEDANKGIKPSPFGEFRFVVPVAPVSVQSTRARKDAQEKLIRAELSHYTFLLVGDVSIEVTWLLDFVTRYESDSAPDVDNILKPLLDSVVGPTGILVDDCQVNSIIASAQSWMDREEVQIHIRFIPDEFVQKDGLIFVELDRNLCFPLNERKPDDVMRICIEMLERSMAARDELEALGASREEARYLMPARRLFHKSRVVRHFPCESLASFKARRGFL